VKTRTDKKPDTHKPQEKIRKDTRIDTIDWQVINTEKEPPITGDDVFGPGIIKKDKYNISLLMPLSNRKSGGNLESIQPGSKTHRFVNYYGGVLLALEDLEAEGIELKVNVFDSEADEKKVKSILEEAELQETDLIIGPHNRSALRKAADFAKENETLLLAPWQASEKMTNDNPFYIQATPNLKDHYLHILNHALSAFDPEQIVFLAREENSRDKNRLKLFQEYFQETEKDAEPIKELYLSNDSLLVGDTVFYNQFLVDELTVFIIPNWSFNDEDFIYHCLRKMNVEKGENEVVVYGMPILLESDKISFDYFRNLNLRICRSNFVDKGDYSIKQFKKRFYNKYRDLPSDDAYEAYDLTQFAGRALDKYGIHFQYYVGDDEFSYLQTSYKIMRHSSQGKGLDSSRPNDFDYFVNKSLDIVVFENDRFRRSKS
jgi:hypothetical protein